MTKTKIAKGFTLIELLVVIVIIGILATLATVTLGGARSKARDARRISDVKQIQTALELFYNDTGGYPVSGSVAKDAAMWSGTVTYMVKVPGNPSGDSAVTCPSPAGDASYTYGQNGSYTGVYSSSYSMGYCLNGATGSILAGSHAATPGSIQNP